MYYHSIMGTIRPESFIHIRRVTNAFTAPYSSRLACCFVTCYNRKIFLALFSLCGKSVEKKHATGAAADYCYGRVVVMIAHKYCFVASCLLLLLLGSWIVVLSFVLVPTCARHMPPRKMKKLLS
eukprot:scaffold138747_cov60-Cyclotella_meneghiniana.AAC.2